MRWIALIALLASATTASADIYIVTQGGVWKVAISNSGTPSVSSQVLDFEPADRVLIAVGDSPAPNPDPDPEPEPDLVKKIEKITTDNLDKKKQTEALLAILTTIRNLQASDPDFLVNAALDALVTRTDDQQIRAWRQDMASLGKWEKGLLDSTIQALENVSKSDASTAVKDRSLGDWLPLILQIIELIIKLFENR